MAQTFLCFWSMDRNFASLKWPLSWHNFFFNCQSFNRSKVPRKDQRPDFQALVFSGDINILSETLQCSCASNVDAVGGPLRATECIILLDRMIPVMKHLHPIAPAMSMQLTGPDAWLAESRNRQQTKIWSIIRNNQQGTSVGLVLDSKCNVLWMYCCWITQGGIDNKWFKHFNSVFSITLTLMMIEYYFTRYTTRTACCDTAGKHWVILETT